MPPFNVLFEGVTPGPARDAVAEAISRLDVHTAHFPAAGRFATTEAVVRRGLPQARVVASDLSLFSSIIGYLADHRRELADLGITISGDPEMFLDGAADDFEVGAAAMMGLKWHQLKPHQQHGMNLRRELRASYPKYRERLANEMRELVAGLTDENGQGIRYEVSDLREHVSLVKDDGDSVLFINPPYFGPTHYHDLLFNESVDWTAKQGMDAPWDKQALYELYQELDGAPITAFLYSMDKQYVPEGWDTIYGIMRKGGRRDYVVVNKVLDSDKRVFLTKQAVYSAPPTMFPIYDDHEITPESSIRFVEIDRPTAMYYRDLFVHRLGSVNSEWYLGLLVDEQLTTVLGLNRADFMRFKVPYIRETFGITISSHRYKRLGKLFMILLTTQEFYDWTRTHTRQGIRRAEGIQTTSLTKHPEGKTDRGVLKVIKREQVKGGTWRLVYASSFRDMTYADGLGEWLKKHGKLKRKKEVNAT